MDSLSKPQRQVVTLTLDSGAMIEVDDGTVTIHGAVSIPGVQVQALMSNNA
jgi:hypothetical protein